jgi:hypothetical protein
MASEIQIGERNVESVQGGSLVERLADKLGAAANITKVYGEPIDRDGTTIIPVAKVRYGFGGGDGVQKDQRGSGGGGGVLVTPYGYIEVRNGSSEFRRITGPNVPMVLAGGLASLIAIRALSMLLGKRRTLLSRLLQNGPKTLPRLKRTRDRMQFVRRYDAPER